MAGAVNRLDATRRTVLRGCIAALASPLLPGVVARASAGTMGPETHGLSVFGDLAEQPGFKAFPYVRADAPKGGSVSQEVFGTFNSLNAYILKGDSPSSMSLVLDSLMAPSLDERDALYGLVAKSVQISPDQRFLRFELREEARFHDETPLTARDVVFSLLTLKAKGHPTIQQ
jgi:microcin C transport system substrate-binding protein